MPYQNYAGAWLPDSQQGPQITGSNANQTVYGPNSATTWGVTGANDTLVGGTGDNFYWLPNAGLTIQQHAGGVNTVEIWQNYQLPANVQNLISFGAGQYAAGNSMNNVIQATAAGESIYGGTGDDVFVGSGGSGTTFIVTAGEGDKVIQNFAEGADTLRLLGGGNLTSFAAVQAAMTQVGSNVDLNDGGTHILFRNASVGQFSAHDFQLPLNYASLGAPTYSEDFNDASTIGSNWQTSFGAPGSLTSYTLPNNGEQEIYTSSGFTGTGSSPLGLNPFSVSNGVLTITASPVSSSQSSQMWGYKYSSGMLLSNYTQEYGYYEIRAQLPQGQGLWPAFWLMGTTSQSEIDVLEALGSNPQIADTAVHAPSISPGYSHANYNPSAGGFHTYGVLWDPQHITYYVDGTAVWQTATPSDMNTPMRMIVNLAVGGNWPGSPDATTPWPAQMQVDYVRAYALPGVTVASPAPPSSPPPPPPAPTPTPTTSGSGQTFTSPGPGSTETGGSGNDTFYPSQGNDTLTGGGGSNDYIFQKEPWAPDTITDFKVGTDKLDLSALFSTYGYSGSDPIKDGWISLYADGSGGTIVRLQDHTGASQWGNTIIDLKGVATSGLTWAQLSGGSGSTSSSSGGTPSPSSSGGSGQTLTSPGPGSTETGGSGNDTFYPSQGNDTLTGGGGSNDYIFQKEPWAPDTITDFKVGTDKLDLSALFSTYGYSGSDPIKDGWISLYADGSGGTIVRLQDHTGASQWGNTIIDLKGVATSGLTWAQLSGGGGASSPTPTPTPSPSPTTGVTLTAASPGQSLTGGAGNDTLIGGPGNDTLTGAGGVNTFKFNMQPWAPNTITDFKPGTDKLDISGLLSHYGYTGTDPIHDGWMNVYSDGNGGSILRFQDHTGASQWGNTIIDLQHVAPAQVSESDWILH